MRKPHVVGILGGMGPAAGADFARLFVSACAEHMRASGQVVSDQGFPEHWLAQIPVPDRSAALDSPDLGAHQPLEPMLQVLSKLTALGASTVDMACNTAHAWHSALQERFPQLELLHVAREVASNLASCGTREVGLLATAGTYRTGFYGQALHTVGVQCRIPQPHEQDILMHGVYQGVKAGNMTLARACFTQVAESLARRHGLSTLVLGCTEIPLALHGVPGLDVLSLVDPAVLLAKALAHRAYQV